MAAELSAATYRLFANAMNGYGRPGAEQRYLSQAGKAYENPLATRPGGVHLNFPQGQNGPRFDYNQQIAQRYPNTWGQPNAGDNTRATGWTPQIQPASQVGSWSSQMQAPQMSQWSSQGQPLQGNPNYTPIPYVPQGHPIQGNPNYTPIPYVPPGQPMQGDPNYHPIPYNQAAMPAMQPNVMGINRIGGDPRVPQAPTPQQYFSPAQLQNMQMGNSRTWGPGTSPYAGMGNYPVTMQGQPAPGNPAYGYASNGLNGGRGGLPK